MQISDKRHFSRIRRLERMMLHGKDVSAENIQNKTANRVLKSWSLNTISYEFSKFTTIFHQQELNSFSSHFMFLNKINLKHQVSIRWQIEHFLWGAGCVMRITWKMQIQGLHQLSEKRVRYCQPTQSLTKMSKFKIVLICNTSGILDL